MASSWGCSIPGVWASAAEGSALEAMVESAAEALLCTKQTTGPVCHSGFSRMSGCSRVLSRAWGCLGPCFQSCHHCSRMGIPLCKRCRQAGDLEVAAAVGKGLVEEGLGLVVGKAVGSVAVMAVGTAAAGLVAAAVAAAEELFRESSLWMPSHW
jgi:hypothetical protein